jgi:cyclopropane fatty-acyl-phospholipid synthase-like methyltransferase
MLQYVLAAQALKAFSLNGATKRLYRNLGNSLGGRSRERGLPAHYLSRADGNLAQLERSGAIRDGLRLMEIGTGWVHWEALFVRCFYDVSIVVMDVWDNRQFAGFKAYAAELGRRLDETQRSEDQKRRARHVLADVARCTSFDEAYDLLGFRYVIGVENAYGSIGDSELDAIFSSDVLEHVSASAIPEMSREHLRMLKPGGVSSHQVVPYDHLCIYDRRVNNKNYLRYDDTVWNRFFANDVQYVNRIQMSEWAHLFEEAGFEVECQPTCQVDVSSLKIADRFRRLPPSDLGVTVFHLMARKPI